MRNLQCIKVSLLQNHFAKSFGFYVATVAVWFPGGETRGVERYREIQREIEVGWVGADAKRTWELIYN